MSIPLQPEERVVNVSVSVISGLDFKTVVKWCGIFCFRFYVVLWFIDIYLSNQYLTPPLPSPVGRIIPNLNVFDIYQLRMVKC